MEKSSQEKSFKFYLTESELKLIIHSMSGYFFPPVQQDEAYELIEKFKGYLTHAS